MCNFKIIKEIVIMIADCNKHHNYKRNSKNKALYVTMKLYCTDICNYKEKKYKGKSVTNKIYLHAANCFCSYVSKRLKSAAVICNKTDDEQNHPVLAVFSKPLFIEHYKFHQRNKKSN